MKDRLQQLTYHSGVPVVVAAFVVALCTIPCAGQVENQQAKTEVFVRDGEPVAVRGSGTSDMLEQGGFLVIPGGLEGDFGDAPEWKIKGWSKFGWGNTLEGDLAINNGDFHVHARLGLPEIEGSGASFIMGGGYHTPHAVPEGRHAMRIWMDGTDGKMYVLDYPSSRKESGPWPTRPYNTSVITEKYPRIRNAGRSEIGIVNRHITAGKPFNFDLVRKDGIFTLRIDGKQVFSSPLTLKRWPANFGFLADRGSIQLQEFWARGSFSRPLVEHNDVWTIASHGYNSYRIPALSMTNEGTLLAFAEARRPGNSLGEVDLVMKRSANSGKTWSEQQVVWDTGDERFFARDPSPVVDRQTGQVFVLVGSNVSRPGADNAGRPRLFAMNSRDNGKSWSAPRPLNLIEDDMESLRTGPASGIQLTRGKHKGRLVAPGNANSMGKSRSCVVYSDDHGKTWKLGGMATTHSNESTVVELEDGTVLLNPRPGGEAYLSRDGGETFDLADWKVFPRGIDAALLRHSWSNEADKGGKSRVLFSYPATGSQPRRKMVVKMTNDDCRSWPVSRLLYPGGAAYSGMTALPNGRIGVLYEKDDYRRISFVSISIDWLTGKKR